MLAIMPSQECLPDVCVAPGETKQRIPGDKLMIKGNHAVTRATLVFTFVAASDTADGRGLGLAIGPEPPKGFLILCWLEPRQRLWLLHAPLL